jgi:alpha-tubulin suppressor-like RCC1 family protein
MKRIFSILFALMLLVSLGLATAAPVLAEVSPGWTDITQFAAGFYHTVGLQSDGTVVAVGDNLAGQCDVGGWTGIDQVAAGGYHTVGVKDDGTVVAVGDNLEGRCDVGGWTGIDQVAAGGYHTVGVKDDGTVVAVGPNYDGRCNVGDWTDIDQVAAGGLHTVAVKDDETVVAVGDNYYGQCDVGNWTNITQVAAGYYHTVGLKSDGTVVAVGNNAYGQCNVGDWTNIIHVAAGGAHTVGLKSDGTVVAVGLNDYGQCDVDEWTDIIRVAGGGWYTAGLRDDGTVVAVGNNNFGQCGGGVTQTIIGGGTVDAIDEAYTEVVVTGTATVTVFRYDDNPGSESRPSGFGSLGKYSDVYVPDISGVTEIEIRLYYTDAELAAAGVEDESLLQPLWWDGNEWRVHSDIGVNTTNTNGYSGYMWAKIKATGTEPSLYDLTGLAEDQGYGSGSGLPHQGCGCFIATAAYGTDTAKEIDILREFRDAVLLPNGLGAKFVSFYYKTSPPVADFISQHAVLRTVVRVGFVDPIVKILTWTHDLWST